jgi:hypothetical protein
MNPTRVRTLFPGAEIDAEGFCTVDKRIMIILDAPYGCHINVTSLPFEQLEAVMYWYQNSAKFAGMGPPRPLVKADPKLNLLTTSLRALDQPGPGRFLLAARSTAPCP